MRFSGANVNKALKTSSPGGGLFHHHNKAKEIREFPNLGYCDISASGLVGKLKRRGESGILVAIYPTYRTDQGKWDA